MVIHAAANAVSAGCPLAPRQCFQLRSVLQERHEQLAELITESNGTLYSLMMELQQVTTPIQQVLPTLRTYANAHFNQWTFYNDPELQEQYDLVSHKSIPPSTDLFADYNFKLEEAARAADHKTQQFQLKQQSNPHQAQKNLQAELERTEERQGELIYKHKRFAQLYQISQTTARHLAETYSNLWHNDFTIDNNDQAVATIKVLATLVQGCDILDQAINNAKEMITNGKYNDKIFPYDTSTDHRLRPEDVVSGMVIHKPTTEEHKWQNILTATMTSYIEEKIHQMKPKIDIPFATVLNARNQRVLHRRTHKVLVDIQPQLALGNHPQPAPDDRPTATAARQYIHDVCTRKIHADFKWIVCQACENVYAKTESHCDACGCTFDFTQINQEHIKFYVANVHDIEDNTSLRLIRCKRKKESSHPDWQIYKKVKKLLID